MSLRLHALLGTTTLLASCSLLFEETVSENQSDAAPAVDAAQDAPANHLISSFTVLPLGCGETKVVPTNVDVLVAPGSPAIARYRWVMHDPDGNEVLNALGAPADVPERAARILDGSYEAPEFNLTLYRGKRMGLFRRTAGAAVPSLLQRLPLTAGEYELEAVVSIPAGGSMESHLRNGNVDGVSYSTNVAYDCVPAATCDALQYKQFRFSTNGNLTGSVTNGMLQFVVWGVGDYLIDGVRLRMVPDGAELLSNTSFRDLTEWDVGNRDTGELLTTPIPDLMAAYGIYTLSLSAVDESGYEGPAATTSISHTECE